MARNDRLAEASIEQLEHALQAKRAAASVRAAMAWPQRLVMWAHTEKVLETDVGALFARDVWGNVDPPRLFWHIGAEIQLEFEVREDGDGDLVSIVHNGVRWKPVGPVHNPEGDTRDGK